MRRLLYCFVFLLMLIPALAAAQDFPLPVQRALDDLNARLGLKLALTDFNWVYNQTVYNDASLGCPQPGIAYAQVQTKGYKVELEVQGLTWDYRVSNDMTRVILCSPLSTPTPTLRPTFPPPIYIIPSAVPGSTATPDFCPNANTPRLIVGSLATVLPDVANIVRTAPGESGGFLGELPVGRDVYVLDGPRCTADMAWWYVADTQSRLVGWTSEGEVGRYWLEPYQYPFTMQPLPTLTDGGMAPTITPLPTDTQAFRPTSTRPAATPTLPAFIMNTSVGPTSAPPRPTGTATPNFSQMRPTGTATPNFAIPFPTQPPSSSGSQVNCAPNLPPRLVVGGSGRVTPGLPNNLRQGPGSSTAYVGEIPPGGQFTVLEGPSCGSGMSWWKVNYNGTIGWTPEGIYPEYWVEPT